MEGSVSKASHAHNTRDGLPLCSVEGADSGGNGSPEKQKVVDVAPILAAFPRHCFLACHAALGPSDRMPSMLLVQQAVCQ